MNFHRWGLGLASFLAVVVARGGEPADRHEVELAKMIVTVREKFPVVKQLSTTNLAAWLAQMLKPERRAP